MRIGELMMTTGVKFGTSGARGLVSDMTDQVCYSYARGFLRYLADSGQLAAGAPVALGGDDRASTGRILAACAQAVRDVGGAPRYCGRIPAPALAAFGLAEGMASLMVTGSHIPEDRNGIKFNLATGEILKEDEAGIARTPVELPEGQFDAKGAFCGTAPALPAEEPEALHAYVRRYLDAFAPDALSGLRIGLYEHSTVAREPLYAILTGLGAEVTRLGRSQTFVPVDTEAIRPEDALLARQWCRDHAFDALVSADGDGDRPLLGDAQGRWLRGDIAGILCAQALGAQALATPVSCNTAVELSGAFASVRRTRIGSPYVIEGMRALSAAGYVPVVGYEANGGFLIQDPIERHGRQLPALPTRDAAIVAVAVLAEARACGLSLAELCTRLPPRFTASDRIKNFPVELSRERLAAFNSGDNDSDRQAFSAAFAQVFAPVATMDHTDGVRAQLTNGEILHLRPSGNAPELRVYSEADTPERASAMSQQCLEILRTWL